MSIRQDIGIVTAYGYAVSKGYQGTEEEFAEAMAAVGTNVDEITDAIDTFINQTVPAATQAVTDEGLAQIGAVNQAGADQVDAVEDKGTIEIGAVEAAGTAQIGLVEGAGTTQVGLVNTAGTTQVGNVNTAGSTQVAAVNAKGEEVIQSIPADYSELTQEVSDLNQAINQTEENLEDLADDGKLIVLNPANLFSDPTFAKGKWGANGLTLAYTDREGTLSKVCVCTKIGSSSGYLEYIFPISVFENGATYRISIKIPVSDNSQVIAIRQNINGQYGNPGNWIVTDAAMTKDYQSESHSDFHYDWTVDTSKFGSYQYVQIGFKVTSLTRSFFEPFIGLSSGDTDYTVSYELPTYTETREPKNIFEGELYQDHRYGDAGYVANTGQYCTKPQLLPAGTYLCAISTAYLGTSLNNKVFKFAGPDGTVGWTAYIPVTVVQASITYCGRYFQYVYLYKFTINDDTYVGCNVGGGEPLAKRFMIVKGNTLADFPESYVAYFEPHIVEKEPAKLNASMISEVSRLYGKNVAVNGDSICEGGGDHPDGFIMPVASRNGMIYSNIGVSGGTLASGTTSGGNNRHWIAETIQNMPSGYDYYIFEGGVNDCANNVPVGTLSNIYPVKGADNDNIDKTTVIGAVEYACRDLVTIFAGKKYGYIFPHRIFPLTDSGQPHPWYTTYKPGIISALEKWGVPYLDLGNEVPPLNQVDSLKAVYTNNGDGWHPNAAGYEAFYTEKIKSWMETL